MSDGESYILKVEGTDISSSDEDLSGFNGDLNNSTDIDALHKLLGDTLTTEANDSETMIDAGHDSSLTVEEHPLSALEELELLFGDSGVSDDEDFLLQTSEPSSAEEDFNDVTALDELKAFLGETDQAGAGDIETSLMSTLEYSFENRRLVQDELQNLLQSCIDEIKAGTKSTIDDASIIADAVYPSRDELQNLLETTLSQLMLFSENSSSAISTDSASVLDELENYMHEADEYEVSATDEEEGVKHLGSDSILDELNLLLGNTSANTVDAKLTSEYPTSDISDENSVQDELAAYMVELSNDSEIENEISVEEPVVESTDADFNNASDTLEELEAMLNEIGISGNDETSDSIKVSDDSSYEHETGSTFVGDSREKKVKADNKFHTEVQSNTVVADKATIEKTAITAPVEEDDLLHEQDSNGRVPKAGLLYATVAAAVIYGVWGLLHTGEEIDHNVEKIVIRQHESDSMAVLKERSIVSTPTEDDSIYALLANTEKIRYVSTSSYEDEVLNIEINKTDSESTVTQKFYEEIPGKEDGKKTEEKVEELISLQMNSLQLENRENINQLTKRMIEAEVSIALLQVENTIIHDQKDFVDPLRHEPSEVTKSSELQVKQEVIEPPVRKVIAARTQVKESDLWSVHLSSYYGEPPPAGELEYLEKAGISYEIKKAIVDEKVWYRVIVDKFSAYEKAREYLNGIRKNVGRDDIWVNRSQ